MPARYAHPLRSLLLAATLAAAAPAAAQTVTNGPANVPNTGLPVFSVNPLFVAAYGHTQLVYAASLFGAGPVDITAFSFARNATFSFGQHVSTNAFTITFGVTARTPSGPNALSAVAADNAQTAVQAFYSGTLPGATGANVDPLYRIDGIAPYRYDPSQGNLLLTVTAPGPYQIPGQSHEILLHEVSNDPAKCGRSFAFTNTSGAPVSSVGTLCPVTVFDVAPVVTAAPEPATVVLVAGGLLALAAARRRRATT